MHVEHVQRVLHKQLEKKKKKKGIDGKKKNDLCAKMAN